MRKEDLYSALSALDGGLVDAVYDEKHKNAEKLAKRRKRTVRVILVAAAAALIAAAIPITAIAMKAPEEQPPAVQTEQTEKTKSTEQATTTPENTPTPTDTPVTPTPTETTVTTLTNTPTTEPTKPVVQLEPPFYMNFWGLPIAAVRIKDCFPDKAYFDGYKQFETYSFDVLWCVGSLFYYGQTQDYLPRSQYIFIPKDDAVEIKDNDVFLCEINPMDHPLIDSEGFYSFTVHWTLPITEDGLVINGVTDSYTADMFKEINREIDHALEWKQKWETQWTEAPSLMMQFLEGPVRAVMDLHIRSGSTSDELKEIFEWFAVLCKCESEYETYLYENYSTFGIEL